MAVFTLERTGPSFGSATARIVSELQGANRTVGKEIAKVGKKAMLDDVKSRRGSLRFGGGKLGIKTPRPRVTAAGCTVEFRGESAGAWAMISTGTKPHTITRKRAKALHWGGDAYATSVRHPGTSGRQYWQSAGRALDVAVADVIEEVYDKALVA